MKCRLVTLAAALALTLGALACGDDGPSTGSGGEGDSGTASGTASDTKAEGMDTDAECFVGAEGCPCTGGGSCDAGLTCVDGLCEDACEIGLEGCPCTQGGACDSGLMCEGGLCVPIGGDGDPGDGDGDGDGDPGGDGDPSGPMCEDLQNDCPDADDPSQCICADCDPGNGCGQGEDCVCPDCTDQNFCDVCNNNGLCDPYNENCACADCMGHVSCQ